MMLNLFHVTVVCTPKFFFQFTMKTEMESSPFLTIAVDDSFICTIYLIERITNGAHKVGNNSSLFY
ncbi:CLUMA_CG000910, isoform A [Clunio marinus]|uniref:CLUMA_CG000910, isoform A n=1 Tax=Clunio marinus TaxID=568069 RepID=A0A1J1HLI6_9DIPT|nr:CLUMA_CG000910, isoform A [Clunio marinus]